MNIIGIRFVNKTHVLWLFLGIVYCLELFSAIFYGKQRTTILLLTPLLIAFIAQLRVREKALIFLFLLLISMFSTKWLGVPYFGLPVTGFMVLCFIIQLSYKHQSEIYRKYGLFLTFSFVSLVTTIINKDFDIFWIGYCLLPLLCMVTVDTVLKHNEDKRKLIQYIFFTLMGYLILYFIAANLGGTYNIGTSDEYAGIYDPGELLSWGVGSRFVVIGPLYYIMGHNMQAAIMSLFCVIAFWYAIRKNQLVRVRVICMVLSISSLIMIFKTTGRAIFIATVSAVFIMLLFMGNKRAMAAISGIALSIFVISGPNIERLITSIAPAAGIERYYEMRYGFSNIGNYSSRIELLSNNIILCFSKPFGHGFNYYSRDGIDEAVLYSNVISGTGLVGFLIFMLIMLKLTISYSLRIMKTKNTEKREMAVLGIGAIALILISGFSQRYLFGYGIYALLCWLILAATYTAVNSSIYLKS